MSLHVIYFAMANNNRRCLHFMLTPHLDYNKNNKTIAVNSYSMSLQEHLNSDGQQFHQYKEKNNYLSP
jgi:hypothetical protein